MSASRTTIRDIAEQLNVHQSTVSRALKNDRRISTETKKRVLQLAEKLKYQPDPMRHLEKVFFLLSDAESFESATIRESDVETGCSRDF